jgi:hypothetical protein
MSKYKLDLQHCLIKYDMKTNKLCAKIKSVTKV